MNLILDAGNTRLKAAIFNSGELQHQASFLNETAIDELKMLLQQFQGINKCAIASVSILSKEIEEMLNNQLYVHRVTSASKIPFKNLYATPETLGVDRLALAAAAITLYPQKNVLVIDAGTCITYDFLNEKGEYLGGAISPGLQMRFNALYSFTAKLPLITELETEDFIGNSTRNSIISGVVNGVLHEIDGAVGLYSRRFSQLTVILTGGDAQFLSKRLKNTIFANQNFLLFGLNRILELN